MVEFFSLLMINAVGLFLMFFYLKKRVDRAVQPERLLEKVRTEVQRMIVEINQTTDGSIGLIEDRMKALDELLSRTDKRIGTLRREIDKHDMSTQVYTNITKKVQPAPPPEAVPAEPPVKRSLREEVLELHRKGFGTELIAQKLGVTISEADMIISLRSDRT